MRIWTIVLCMVYGSAASSAAVAQPVAEYAVSVLSQQSRTVIVEPGQVQSEMQVYLDGDGVVRIEARSLDSTFQLVIIGPNNDEINQANVGMFGGVYFETDSPASLLAPILINPMAVFAGVHQSVVRLPGLEPGLYRIVVRLDEATVERAPVLVRVDQDSSFGAAAWWADGLVQLESANVLMFCLAESGVPVTPQSIVAELTAPSGNRAAILLRDDGVNPDALANDGVYSALCDAADVGLHVAWVSAIFTTPEEVVVRREAGASFFVTAPGARFDRPDPFTDAAHDSNADGLFDSIRVTAAVDVQTAATYILQLHFVEHTTGEPARVHVEADLTPGSRTMSGNIDVDPWLIPTVGTRYDLTDAFLTMVHDGRIVTVDEMHTPHETWATAAYHTTTIPRRGVYLDEFTVTRVDADGDADFDVVRCLAEVRVAAGGTYGYSGTLYDSCHEPIEHIEGEGR